MKNQSSHITKSSKAFEQLSFQFGDFSIVCRSARTLQVKLPISTMTLQEIIVNGEVFCRPGKKQQIIRVAPIKYPDMHFREVNSLVERKHYSQEASIRDVADAHGYDLGNFRRQFFSRKGSLMGVEELK